MSNAPILYFAVGVVIYSALWSWNRLWDHARMGVWRHDLEFAIALVLLWPLVALTVLYALGLKAWDWLLSQAP